MTKLLQINSCANWGSTGRIAEQINNIARERGWDTFIAYGRDALLCKSQLIHIGGKLSQAIALFSSRCFDNEGLSNRVATRQLIRTIKQIKPDIIHLHNLHGYYINYRILFKYLNSANIPVVWTLHDCWAITGHCSGFTTFGCDRWMTLCNKCPHKKAYPSSLLFDASKRNYQLKKQLFGENRNLYIITVSEWLANVVKKSFLQNQPIRCIKNGIDTNEFQPIESRGICEKYGIGNQKYIVGVASTWTVKKGLNDYVKLSEKLGNSDIKIVLVGVTSQQKINLQQYGIIGILRTDNVKELAGLYSGAEIVMNLSWGETFGLTTVEGFACGVPSIVYNCTASPELVTSETGIVVEPGNIDEVVSAIQTILAKGKQNYSRACRERAVCCYYKEDRYNEYVDLYESLINNKVSE